MSDEKSSKDDKDEKGGGSQRKDAKGSESEFDFKFKPMDFDDKFDFAFEEPNIQAFEDSIKDFEATAAKFEAKVAAEVACESKPDPVKAASDAAEIDATLAEFKANLARASTGAGSASPAPKVRTVKHPTLPGNAITITDKNQATISYAPHYIKPCQLKYADGSMASFVYDQAAHLEYLINKFGIEWTREGAQDKDGFAIWKASTGQRARYSFVVFPDGTYQRADIRGNIKTFSTDGKAVASVVFSEGYDLRKLILRIFKLIDKNQDGSLTVQELKKAGLRHWNDADEAKLVAMLRVHFANVLAISTETPGEEPGITIHDIVRYDKITREQQEASFTVPEYVMQTLEQLFTDVDANKDGIITLVELETALERSILAEAQREIINTLVKQLRGLVKTGPVGVAKADLLKQYKAIFKDEVMRRTATNGWGVPLETDTWAGDLFAGSAKDCVKLEALKRGTVGDGLFAATLACVTAANPTDISEMVTEENEGIFCVNFPGAEESIIVEHPAPYDVSLYSEGSKYGLWPAIFDEAYNCYLDNNPQMKHTFPPLTAEAFSEPCTAVQLLTGSPGKWYYLKDLTDRTLLSILDSAFARKDPLLAASLGMRDRKVQEAGIVSNQPCSVWWDPSLQLIAVRSAWGIAPKIADTLPAEQVNQDLGVVRMSLDKFRTYFNVIYFCQDTFSA